MGFRSIVMLVLALAAGVFAYKFIGGVSAPLIAFGATAYALYKLMAGELMQGLVAVCVGVAALFYLMLSGVGISGKASAQRGEPLTPPAIEFVPAGPSGAVGSPGGAPAVAEAAPGEPAAAAAVAPGASAAPAMKAGKVFRDCADCPDLVVLPAGEFAMGSAAGAPGADADGRESPAHKVALRSFAIGQDAVTRGQFAAFVRATQYRTEAETQGGCFAIAAGKWDFVALLNWRKPGFTQADNHPAVCISWNDAQAYVQWLSQSTRQTYRLPSESEYEYASRAGSLDAYWWGNTAQAQQANFSDDAPGAAKRGATVPVKQFAANPFGLYNVHGNVWQWVQDCQHDNYQGAPADGRAWTANCAGNRRGVRGGAWVSQAAGLRASQRNWFAPDLPSYAGGVRVARELAP